MLCCGLCRIVVLRCKCPVLSRSHCALCENMNADVRSCVTQSASRIVSDRPARQHVPRIRRRLHHPRYVFCPIIGVLLHLLFIPPVDRLMIYITPQASSIGRILIIRKKGTLPGSRMGSRRIGWVRLRSDRIWDPMVVRLGRGGYRRSRW